jgi:hypothetical protein
VKGFQYLSGLENTAKQDEIVSENLSRQQVQKPILYLIPGQGADERLFANLNVEEVEIKVLTFLVQEKNESLAHYARRMAQTVQKRNFLANLQYFCLLICRNLSQCPPKDSCNLNDFIVIINKISVNALKEASKHKKCLFRASFKALLPNILIALLKL